MSDSDPRPLLRKLYEYPISTLAVLADHRGAVSGGQSVEEFFRGKGTRPESDFDIYLPRNPDAIMDTMHLLRIAGVTWRNGLSATFEDIRECKSAMLPAKTLFRMALELCIHPGNLGPYIKVRFGDNGDCSKFANSLALGLREAYKINHDSQNKGLYEEDHWWYYDSQRGEGRFVVLHETFKRCTDDLLDPRNRFSERKFKEKIEKQKRRWKKQGLRVTLFWKHLLRRLRTEGRPTKDDRIQDIVDKCFPEKFPKRRSGNTEKTGKIEDRKTEEPTLAYPSFDFQMLQGTLKGGTKVQLMLLPPNESILHSVLKFYATHIMSFIGGIFKAHLYYDLSKEYKSYTFDISEDQYKHKHSFRGISKYQERGWTFEEFPKSEDTLRSGGDPKVKMVSFRDIYRSALRTQCGDAQDIPKGVEDYFQKRESAFRVSNWTERERKIEHINYVDYEGEKGSNHKPAGVVDWVHDALDGHKDVTPKAEWNKREELQFVLLDLWFGGAAAAAIHTAHDRQGISPENVLFISDEQSDSERTLVSDSDF
ncbi:hypothetical protein AALT_g11717 [Alternaria alternata]|nr:hypothetical protein AALT_g11717 [Alternaria alternata]